VSDRSDRSTVLTVGVVLLIGADVVLGLSTSIWTLVLGVSLWGLHLAFTQGQLSAMIADVTPPELRGSAYGVFNLVSGLMMLIASIIAGVVCDTFGSSTTFFVGAFLATLPLFTRQQRSPAALPGSNAAGQNQGDGGDAVG
jgi:MFS family permease